MLQTSNFVGQQYFPGTISFGEVKKNNGKKTPKTTRKLQEKNTTKKSQKSLFVSFHNMDKIMQNLEAVQYGEKQTKKEN